VYDVNNMKAAELARYLQQIYGSGKTTSSSAGEVAPGLKTKTLESLATDSSGTQSLASLQSAGTSQEESSENSDNSDAEPSDSADTTESSDSAADDNGIRITAQQSSNQLLIRARPSQWQEIENAIHRLDSVPKQVQIETRILEVSLTGELDQGVQWYLGRLAGSSSSDVANTAGSQGALGAGGMGLGSTDSLFYSFVGKRLQVALHALETNERTQVLSAPSLVVMNNQKAQIQVRDDIPVSQTSINTSSSSSTVSSVEYVQTGVILNVVPRINPDGRVYMEIRQQVSDAGSTSTDSSNPTISTRSISTQVAVQSGQTLLLGGLIKQNNAQSDSHVPFLGRIPGLRWLFGSVSKSHNRTELIVLITPRVISDSHQAHQVTDDYREQMQLLQPGANG